MSKSTEILAKILFPRQKTNSKGEVLQRFTLRKMGDKNDFDEIMEELEKDGEIKREEKRGRVTYLK